jgi:hypothetical protein
MNARDTTVNVREQEKMTSPPELRSWIPESKLILSNLCANPHENAIKICQRVIDSGNSHLLDWDKLSANPKAQGLFEKYPEKKNRKSVSRCSSLPFNNASLPFNNASLTFDENSDNELWCAFLSRDPQALSWLTTRQKIKNNGYPYSFLWNKVDWYMFNINPCSVSYLAKHHDKIRPTILKNPEGLDLLESVLELTLKWQESWTYLEWYDLSGNPAIWKN